MTMVGGFDVHRTQLTFDYVDTDTGEVCSGQIRPGTREALRNWLGEHCPDGEAEFALGGCTGWRYVAEEVTAVGAVAHLGDPAEIAGLRGPKKRAKSDRTDARLLRTLLWEGRLPQSAVPPTHVLRVDGRATRLAATHPCPGLPSGLPTDSGAALADGP